MDCVCDLVKLPKLGLTLLLPSAHVKVSLFVGIPDETKISLLLLELESTTKKPVSTLMTSEVPISLKSESKF